MCLPVIVNRGAEGAVWPHCQIRFVKGNDLSLMILSLKMPCDESMTFSYHGEFVNYQSFWQ